MSIYVMPMRWTAELLGDGFVAMTELLEHDASRPAKEVPDCVDPTTVIFDYDAQQLPDIKAWLAKAGQHPEIAFLIDLDGDLDGKQSVSFKFENQTDAAKFRLFFG